MLNTKTKRYKALIYLITILVVIASIIIYINFTNPLNYYKYSFEKNFNTLLSSTPLTFNNDFTLEVGNTKTLKELSKFTTDHNKITDLGITLNNKQNSSLLRYGRVISETTLENIDTYFKTIEESNIPILLNNGIIKKILNNKTEKILNSIQTLTNIICSEINSELTKEYLNKLKIFTNETYQLILKNSLDKLNNGECINILKTPIEESDKTVEYINLIFLIDTIRESKLEDKIVTYTSLINIFDNTEFINFEILDEYIKNNINNKRLIDYLDEVRLKNIEYPLTNEVISYIKIYNEGNFKSFKSDKLETLKSRLDINSVESILNILSEYNLKEQSNAIPTTSIENKILIDVDIENIKKLNNFINYLETYLKYINLNNNELDNLLIDIKNDLNNLNNSSYYINYYNYYKYLVSNTLYTKYYYYFQTINDTNPYLSLVPLVTIDLDSTEIEELNTLLTNIQSEYSIELNNSIITNTNISDNNFNESYDYQPIKQFGGSRVPILMYHQIATPPNNFSGQYYVSPDTFEQQIAYLVKKNYKTLDSNELLNLIYTNTNPSQKSVMLTFDDGNYNNYSVGYTILKKYGLKATFGIVSGSISIPQNNLKEMSNNGISIQSHSATHKKFTDLSYDDSFKEAVNSKYVIESITGKEVNLLVYPYCSASSKDVNAVANAGYQIGLSCGGQIDLYYSQRYVLPRVQVYDRLDSFIKGLSGILE